jgi:hypothetical protein
MNMESKYVGNIYTNETGQDFIVTGSEKIRGTWSSGKTSYKTNYHVRFLETGFETTISGSAMTRKRVKDRLHPSVAGIGKMGYVDLGSSNSRAYHIWSSMLDRCYNPNSGHYSIYGQRGVRVSERWHRFDYFLEDLPSIEGYNKELFEKGLVELDKDKKQMNIPHEERIYSLETCTFLLPQENHSYRTESKLESFIATSPSGETFTPTGIRDFAKEHGLNHAGIIQCLNETYKQHKGWKFSRE